MRRDSKVKANHAEENDVSICQNNVEKQALYLFSRLHGGHIVGVSLPLIVAVLKHLFHDYR